MTMKKCMVFAAGLGTRLKPITDTRPKALVEVGGAPLMEHVLLKLKNHGFGFVVINVHHFAEQITDFLKANDSFGLDITISDESGKLLDTGGAVKKACSLFGDTPFLIHNVDILSNADLSSLYDKHIADGADATLLVSDRNSSRKLMFSEDGRLCGWKNENSGEIKLPWSNRTPDNTVKYAFSGIHVFSPRLAAAMTGYPDKFPIMDFYLDNCRTWNIKAEYDSDLVLCDVGKTGSLAEAEALLETLRSR